jgi:CheY-like chemotaxis protein
MAVDDTARSLGSGSRLHGFQDLARYRVHDILLVASLYDAFILTEDGQLSEGVLGRFLSFDTHDAPRLHHAGSGREALALASAGRRFDLVIAAMHVGDMSVVDLAEALRRRGDTTPVIALAYDARDLTETSGEGELLGVDRVFLWQGDVGILPAIVKSVEDRMNVAVDTGEMGVQAIILIEDSVRFYSSFLPVLYGELLRQSQSLVPEGINLSHKLMRLQARPKVLLCTTFEEAWAHFEAHEDNILGVIADIEFPKDGHLQPEAGLTFAQLVRARQPDVPVMLQSSVGENQALAAGIGAAFALKESPTLLHELQRFMIDNFGFGDFVFRLPDGTVVGRARDLRGLEQQLRSVPSASLAYHGERNHFSKWLKARTEFALAHRLRPQRLTDFPTTEHLRRHLIESIHRYQQQQKRGIVADFSSETFDPDASFCRIGGGSLGGKGRGLAFAAFLMEEYGVQARFRQSRIGVPPAVVLGTDLFDRFLDRDGLRDFVLASDDDDQILRRLLGAAFPEAELRELAAFLEAARYPLAVRSSSLLEDSPYQPFAGIYETWMVPNRDPDLRVRLDQLREAVCRVYASTFSRRAKAYLRTSPYRLEEEKMAVVIQRLAGQTRGDRHYPDLAGVARSHNFYAMPPLKPHDGVAAVALGLGATVVGGETCFRFSPKHPRHVVQFSSVEDVLRNSQRMFYALRLDDARPRGDGQYALELRQYGLETAERDGALAAIGSTYSPENDAVFDGISRPGVRLVSFAPVLKHGVFPLAEILSLVLEIGEHGTGGPVEIEFAADINVPHGHPPEFACLQLRPVAPSRELGEVDLGRYDREAVLCQSDAVLGHGREDAVRDVVALDSNRFGAAQSQEIAAEIGRLNAELQAEGRPYLLICVGRLGSREPTLGVPVTWGQIAGARVIVEAGFRDFKVTPSQGSHFFQNLMTAGVGYFTVNPEAGEGMLDWTWLAAQPARSERAGVRHVRLATPLAITMNGMEHRGVIVKP